jgi:hypothetical protein
MTTSAVREETKGYEFLVWATEKERQAVRLVELFLKFATFVGRNEGLDHLVIEMDELHKHLPAFAHGLVCDLTLYDRSPDGTCPAVNLYLRAKDNGKGKSTARMLYLHRLPPPPLPITYWEEIWKMAQRAGLLPDARTGTRLHAYTRETLVKMGTLK